MMNGMHRDTLRRYCEALTRGSFVVGLDDIRRDLSNMMAAPPDVRDASGPTVSRALRQLGWVRDGTIGVGYDRQLRFVRWEHKA